MKRLLLVAATLASTALAALPAHASTIVYGCKWDICAVSPDGSHRRHITTDGTRKNAYRGPRLTAGILSFERGFQNYLADANGRHRRILPHSPDVPGFPEPPLLRPDGRRALFYQGEVIGSYSDYRLCDITIKPGARAHCPELLPADRSAWIWGPGHNFLSTAVFNGQELAGDYICITRDRGDCTKPYFYLPKDGRVFAGAPDLAPNKRWLAAGLYESEGDRSRLYHIVLIDLRRKRLVRDITHGPSDGHPNWSPDGRRIVYLRTLYPHDVEHPVSSICTARVKGGKVRCPVRGVKGLYGLSSPTWDR